ncbi:MAG: hypothetical protein GF404_11505 [candidate division Zixibacteria bacterium]|nr:hypothetical protein [candidate division Zixibacteria bacterium]
MLKKRTLFSALFLLFFCFNLFASEAPVEEDPLPIGLTEEEKTRLDEIGMNHRATNPPPGPGIRSIPEWEPSTGVIIRYPFGISYDIIAEMSEDVIVYTIVSSTSSQSYVTTQYQNNGVNMANVEFIIAPTDSYWTRDYGPWFIFDGNGDIGIVDQIYNRPRPNDDAIPIEVGNYMSIPVYGMDVVATGGNYMSDGYGNAVSTDLVYYENPSLTDDEVDSIINEYMGVDNYIVLDDALGEYIEHIDCWAKFLSPSTVLVLEVPNWHSQYDELNAAADSLANMTNAYGRPYNVVRVLSSGSQAYTNSLILNDKVLVPISNSSYDAAALQVYEDAMPGYEILGFTGSWYNTDALHCRTMGVPDPQMLQVHHTPLLNSADTLNDYLVTATIVDHSEAGLISDSLKVYYSLDGGAFSFVTLTATGNPDEYEAYIPAQSNGTTISYYVKAADLSGRVETNPYVGEAGPYQFEIDLMIPEIGLSDTLFTFQAFQGDKALLYDTLVIFNDGSGTLNWTASQNSLWLALDPTSGTDSGAVELEANTNLLPVGTFYDTITVNCAEAPNTPQTAVVELAVLDPLPEIVLSETELIFQAYHGDPNPASQSFDITNAGSGTLTWGIYNEETWCTPDPMSGSAPATVDVSVDMAGLSVGNYTDTLVISSPEAENSPVKLPVTLNILEPPPIIQLSVGQLMFEAYENDDNPSSQSFDIENIGGSALYWNSSNMHAWCEGDPTSGNAPSTMTVSIDITGMTAGEYYDTISVECTAATNSPQVVEVMLTVLEPLYVCGDANGDESVDVSDAVMIINYAFAGGEPPDPIESGDTNCDEVVDVSDAVYIINYAFAGGNDPCDTDGDTLPDC